MEENKNTFGDTFVNGKVINLDTATTQELEKYIKDIKGKEKEAEITLNKIVEEIKNN